MSEMPRTDMQWEGPLEWFRDLTALDRSYFSVSTSDRDPSTVDEIAEGVDRGRSTAYRAIQRSSRPASSGRDR
jgi:predicted transcriptional regulator